MPATLKKCEGGRSAPYFFLNNFFGTLQKHLRIAQKLDKQHTGDTESLNVGK